ncbi:TOBE domain-containing protein, partial [Serratia marcescens]|uniref:TOBE domain-containing protein n=1 Tax=Serratia marcescens TaxID=615 RepID=UPI002362180E
GGAQLTHYGQRLIQLYDLLGQVQQKAFDVLQQDDLPLDSLLAAISRFSLQTSARNQFFGTVIERDHQQVQQHLAILLNDGSTRLTAAITLQLTPGKEVLALIKAPWVRLSVDAADNADADNALAGVVAGIQPGAEHSEVLVTLAGGETLCATLTTAELQRLQLSVGDAVHALFNADRVIV